MDLKQATGTLRVAEPELKALGVLSASIFGSVARGDANSDSGIDVAVRLSGNFSNGGFDYFARLEDLRRKISGILNCSVDVIEEPVRKQRLQAEIDRDRAIVF